jgi:hypothetical protein
MASTLTMRYVVSLRQNGVGTGFTSADAILPKGHRRSRSRAHAIVGLRVDSITRPI